ncbi:unnamed protein product [Lactuca virosa]|uniref:Uncharacterized protein n=1 Tax=Lactuca virosa TaxID=75947 RepID=A0AAU9NPJ5_9ASTR|nr:unnamed protein product [Lactuca virosa]
MDRGQILLPIIQNGRARPIFIFSNLYPLILFSIFLRPSKNLRPFLPCISSDLTEDHRRRPTQRRTHHCRSRTSSHAPLTPPIPSPPPRLDLPPSASDDVVTSLPVTVLVSLVKLVDNNIG